MNVTIGADPELWIYDNKRECIISADGLFPGTKDNPFKVQHGAIQVDGMAAEFNIDPAATADEFQWNISQVLDQLRQEIKSGNPMLDFKFLFAPIADFAPEYMDAQPAHAKLLGCTPDYNAYTGGQNPTPNAEGTNFRTASGHIHIGWSEDEDIHNEEHLEACRMMVKQMDMMVGMPLVLELSEKKLAEETRRRVLYGKLGAFRPKHYGVEYRSPSNLWVEDVEMRHIVFSQTKRAFEDLIDGVRHYDNLTGSCRRSVDEGNIERVKTSYGYRGWFWKDSFATTTAKTRAPRAKPIKAADLGIDIAPVRAEWAADVGLRAAQVVNPVADDFIRGIGARVVGIDDAHDFEVGVV